MLGSARSGVIHADPNPDDALVLPDGRLAILDFGATRTVDPARTAAAAAGLEAFAEACGVNPDPAGDHGGANQDGFGIVLEQLGWLPCRHAGAAVELGRHALAELAGQVPVRLDADALLAARDRLRERPEALIELILAGALPPEDLWPARAVLQLFATIARVGASGAWLELARGAMAATPAP